MVNRIEDVPFEDILETNDLEIMRKYLHAFNVFIGQTISLKRFDILERELVKRTANTDIIELAMTKSPEIALLIGNYCGTLSLAKEVLTANELRESAIRLNAVRIKKKLAPANTMLQYLVDHPKTTKETLRENTSCTDEEFEHYFNGFFSAKAIVQTEENGVTLFSISEVGKVYLAFVTKQNSVYISSAEDAMKEASQKWRSKDESEESEQ